MDYRQCIIKNLQDLYQTESEQASQLRQFARQANDVDLRTALDDHAIETEQQSARLREILEMIGESPGGNAEVRPGTQGLIAEAQGKNASYDNVFLSDLALIAAAQKIEHYEMAWYGTVRAMARTAGLDEPARLLQITLEEEEATDRRLTDIAMPIHKMAEQATPSKIRVRTKSNEFASPL